MPKASASVTVSARRFTLAASIILALLIISFSAYVSVTKAPNTALETEFINFGGKEYQVAIADTPKARQKGLGDYDSLLPDEGMLFVFEQPGDYCFWMKEVEFAIDIFWFDAEGNVVKSIDSLAPETYPELFCPKEPVKYVLEIAGGQSSQLKKPLKLIR